MDMLTFLDYAIQFLHVIIMVSIFMGMLSSRLSALKCFLAQYTCLMVGWIIIIQFVSYDSGWEPLLFILLELLTSLWFYKDRYTKICFALVVNLMLMALSEGITVALFLLFAPINSLDMSLPSEAKLIGRILFSIVFSVAASLFLAYYNRHKIAISHKSLAMYIFFPLSQVILILGISINNVYNLTFGIVLLELVGVFVSVVANVMLLKLLEDVSQKAEMQERLASMQSMQEMELAYYNLVQQHAAELSMIRHDFKDQIATAYGVISQYSPQEQSVARGILDGMSSNLSKVSMPTVCANRMVNTVVNVKRQQAQNLGIDFEAAIQVPEDICISSIDLCSLYSYLLTNAIEVCERITDPDVDKKIVVQSLSTPKLLSVTVISPLEERLFKKKDKLNGALLDTIVKRYNGRMELSYTKAIFTTQIELEID